MPQRIMFLTLPTPIAKPRPLWDELAYGGYEILSFYESMFDGHVDIAVEQLLSIEDAAAIVIDNLPAESDQFVRDVVAKLVARDQYPVVVVGRDLPGVYGTTTNEPRLVLNLLSRVLSGRGKRVIPRPY